MKKLLPLFLVSITLDGLKINGKPTRKGIYLRNGRKVVIQ